MRKALAIAGVAVLGAALYLALRPDVPDEPPSNPSPALQAAAARIQRATRGLARALPPAPARLVGELAGQVVGSGHALAQVVLDGAGLHRQVRVDAEGRFDFDGLPAGEYRLDASSGELAAETLGPIPLGAGEQIRGLTLQLAESGALSGEVVDSESHAPIAEAQLSAGGAGATTDAQGRFLLQGIPPGQVTLLVSHPGYVTSAVQVAVPRGRAQSGAVLVLSRAAHLSGTVSLADRTPVAGAQVIARHYRLGVVADAHVIARSDATGAFSADVVPGRLTVLATQGSGEGHAPEVDVAPGESRTIDLVLDVAGEIDGQVLEGDGSPSSGAGVVAVEIQTQRASPPTPTGPDGRFRLAGLPEGVYAVIARSGARTAELPGIRLEPGEAREATLRFGGGVILGRVLDALGTPLPGAEVTIAPEGSTPVAASAVQSGAGGAFRVEGLAGARFRIKATHVQGSVERHGVAPGSEEVMLQLVRPSGITGVVTDEGGHAVTDFEVVADPDGPLTPSGATRALGHFASVEGSFHLEVAPGRYRVRVAAPSYLTTEPVAAEAPVQGAALALHFTVRRGKRVHGVVLDAQSRQPVAGAHVADEPSRVYAYGRSTAVSTGASTTTDASGSFTLEIDGTRRGASLYASADGHGFGYAPVPTIEGALATVELRGEPGPRPPDFAGVGMQIGPDFTIPGVFDSGPAWLAGIRSGDRLTSVDGKPVAGHPVEEIIGWIRGEVGTPVALGIQRGSESAVLVPTRAEIKF
jgi:hypothetical protein